MKKLIERLLLFFLGLPLLVASVVFLPHYGYLAFHLEILFFSVLAVLEMHNLLAKKLKVLPLGLLLPISLIIPLASFAYSVARKSVTDQHLHHRNRRIHFVRHRVRHQFQGNRRKGPRADRIVLLHHDLSRIPGNVPFNHHRLGGCRSLARGIFHDGVRMRFLGMVFRHALRQGKQRNDSCQPK